MRSPVEGMRRYHGNKDDAAVEPTVSTTRGDKKDKDKDVAAADQQQQPENVLVDAVNNMDCVLLPVVSSFDDDVVQNMREGLQITGTVAQKVAKKTAPSGKDVLRSMKASIAFAEEAALSARKLISDTKKQMSTKMDLGSFGASASASYSFSDEISSSFTDEKRSSQSYTSGSSEVDSLDFGESSFVLNLAPSDAYVLNTSTIDREAFSVGERESIFESLQTSTIDRGAFSVSGRESISESSLQAVADATELDSVSQCRSATPASNSSAQESTSLSKREASTLDACEDKIIATKNLQREHVNSAQINQFLGTFHVKDDKDDDDDDDSSQFTEETVTDDENDGVDAEITPNDAMPRNESISDDDSEYTEETYVSDVETDDNCKNTVEKSTSKSHDADILLEIIRSFPPIKDAAGTCQNTLLLPDFIKILKDGCASSTTDVRLLSLRSLFNISYDKNSRIAIVEDSILDVLAKCSSNSDVEEKEAALGVLFNISLEPEAIISLANTKDLVPMLVHTINNNETSSSHCVLARRILKAICSWMNAIVGADDQDEDSLRPCSWMMDQQ